MSQGSSERAEFEALDLQYREYITKLRVEWLAQNRPHSKDVLEVMRPQDRQEVDHCIGSWGRYVAPLGEEWWRKRGYKVKWPDDDSKPMLVQKVGVGASL